MNRSREKKKRDERADIYNANARRCVHKWTRLSERRGESWLKGTRSLREEGTI